MTEKDFVDSYYLNSLEPIGKVPKWLDLEINTNCNIVCLTGDTKILMHDFKWKALKNISLNDYIISVKKPKGHKQKFEYIISKVITLFPKRQSKISEITLENGIKIKGTSNHPILTKWGRWIPMERLTKKNPPKFVSIPYDYIENEDYLKGYLNGAWQSDGSMHTYWRNEYNCHMYRARFAVKDKDFLDFTDYCMKQLKIPYRRTKISWNHSSIKEMIVITNKEDYHILKKSIFIPIEIEEDWARGFLAGFLDGDGSYNIGTTLRFFTTYKKLKNIILDCLDLLNFKYTLYKKNKKKSRTLYAIRILGGMKENFRFFSICNPKIPRKRSVGRTQYGTIQVKSIKDYGIDDVYNLETDSGNYIANGLIVHNCKKCFRTFYIPETEYMDQKLAMDIIEEFGKKGGKSIRFIERGEPTLSPSLVTYVKYADVWDLRSVINTNCIELTPKLSNDLINAGISQISCAIDSCQEETYKLLQGNHFKKVILNLKEVYKLSRNTDTIIQVHVNIQKENAEEVYMGIYNDFFEQYSDKVIHQPTYDICNFKKDVELDSKPCIEPWRRLIVLVDGRVMVCPACFNYHTKQVYVVGNILKQSIEEIWNSSLLDVIRTWHSNKMLWKMWPCRSCRVRRYINERCK